MSEVKVKAMKQSYQSNLKDDRFLEQLQTSQIDRIGWFAADGGGSMCIEISKFNS